jgi:aminoglycoside phosphotransferase family enzyme/predicted kinase
MTRKEARTDTRRRPPLVEGLAQPSAYGTGVAEVRVAETHISWVFLTGEHAYKIKKPIKLPFLDFSTLELRRRFCEEELRLNRRLAPDLYLGVVPIGGDASAPRVGAEPAIEYAVKMTQFPDNARLDRQLDSDALPSALRAFGADLARFHSDLPPLAPQDAGVAALTEMRDNFTVLAKHATPADLGPLRGWVERCAAEIGSSIDGRAARGRYRECHGDLHLENLLLEGREIVAFDALEFDPKLRQIDVLSEAAFALMDFSAHGRTDLGYVFLTAYLEAGGDYDGLQVLRFYLVHRALVRAKVHAVKAAQNAAESGRDTLAPYLAAARDFAEPHSPLLVITHGLSGSGKTHVSDALIGGLRAVRARSDLERKRLHGLAPDARTGSVVGAGIYDQSVTDRTYARLAEIAADAVRNGFDAIVDATFLLRAERERFRALADRFGARFAILDCAAPEAVLRSRVAAREAAGRDASEAGLAVLERQLVEREALGRDEAQHGVRVATDRELDTRAVLESLEDLKRRNVAH